MTDLQHTLGRYHESLAAFSKGDPRPVKNLYSHGDDVTLANPFGSTAHGWRQVSDALDYASSRFREGDVAGVERVAAYETGDLACIFELERWRSKVAGRKESASFELRVTSTFRREDGTWKLVHRHADPIATMDPDGPLRGSGR